MVRYIFLFLIMVSPSSKALETVSLKLDKIEMNQWVFQGIETHLSQLNQHPQVLRLSVKKLNLPQPFKDVNLINVHCQQLTWDADKIHCQHGQVTLQSTRFSSPRLNFSFLISPKKTQFTLSQFKLLQGVFHLTATAKLDQWQIKLKGKKIGLQLLQKLLFPKHPLSSGSVDFTLDAEGQGVEPKKITTQINVHQLSIQASDGKIATEKLILKTTLSARQHKDHWYWQQHSTFKQGNLYFQPLYLENKNTAISLSSQGWFNLKNQILTLDKIQFNHPKVMSSQAYATLKLKPKFTLLSANMSVHINNLQTFSTVYLNSITETTELEGLKLKGLIEADLSLKQDQLNEVHLVANKLQIDDLKSRFKLQDGAMSFNWSKEHDYQRSSMISWGKLDIFSIPLPRSYFTLLLKDQQVSLLKPFDIPLLGGTVHIKEFKWESMTDNTPKVIFVGDIKALSLEQLTKTLGSQPLSGYISGHIPGIKFVANTLSLDGGININLLGGEIDINQLSLSGLGTPFSQFSSDIEIHHLDLDLLTQKFEFGGMNGKISGYVRNLTMENWKPITFDALITTPKDDHSRHQISQKAVENLANIGGGGAVDFVSRMILNVFDNFDYDKIGFGCQLKKGVCQLQGVEDAGKNGYYIIKGGGLPRIDIMGHETSIDWNVFLKRLQRLSKTGDVVVDDPLIK